jgi:Big-like domain-containing protein
VRLSSCLAVLASFCVLGSCGGGDSSNPTGPPSAGTLAVVSGDGQFVEQHQMTMPLIVRLTDATGSPVAGATITFAATPDGEQIAPTTAVTGSDGTASWSGVFHSSNTQHITAATPGLTSVTFTINVIATPSIFDGLYDCSFDGGAPVDPMHVADDRVVDQSPGHPIWGGAVDHETGTFNGFYHPSLDIYNNMTGQFAVNATGEGTTGSGTYSKGGPVGSGPGTWTCTSVPNSGVTAPLSIFPPAPTLTVGETVTLFVRDAANRPIEVTWQSSDTAVAGVSPASPATASLGRMTAAATGTATIQVQDPISLIAASTTVTVVQSENVNPWLGTWTGTIREPAPQPEGGLSCGLQVTSPGSATITAGSGNEITFTLFDNGNGTPAVEEIFLVRVGGGTAASASDAGDTLTLSGSTLTWIHNGTGCSSFSGTK